MDEVKLLENNSDSQETVQYIVVRLAMNSTVSISSTLITLSEISELQGFQSLRNISRALSISEVR